LQTLSLIITSFNLKRINDVSELLDSIKTQTKHDFETIIVIEGSTLFVDVKRLVHKKSLKNVQVLLNEGKKGLCEGRNMGIEHSSADILAFVDDDVILTPQWAEELTNTFFDDSIIAVMGSADPLFENSSDDWFPPELDWLLSCTRYFPDELMEIRNVQGFNMAFRREAFQKCGLFPTESGYYRGPMPDDLAFSMAVRKETRKRMLYNPAVRVLHRVHSYRLGRKFIARRAFWIGRTKRRLNQTYSGSMDEDLLYLEKSLLVKIVKALLHSPRTVRKLNVILMTLFYVGMGYMFPSISPSRAPAGESAEP
jgi:glycosyltransferase involved in cell wall biosynthesis